MTLRFRFLNNIQEWVVVGPACELRLGPVVVTKMNGDRVPENIVRLSKAYTVDGEDFRFGYLRALPKGTAASSKRAPLPARRAVLEAASPEPEPDVPDAVLDLAARNQQLLRENAVCTRHLARLLNYVMNMREDFADIDWPDLPDIYTTKVWRAAS